MTAVAELEGDLIIFVKGTRLALNKGVAQKLEGEAEIIILKS